MEETVLINETDDPVYFRFIDGTEKYELSELVKKIDYNKFNELEFTQTKWSYNDFDQIINIFLISDLAKIVYEYVIDTTNLNIIMEYYGKDEPDLHFIAHHSIYNYSLGYFNVGFDILITTCPVICKYVMDHKKIYHIHTCDCKNKHANYVVFGSTEHNSLRNYKPTSEFRKICLMYKIFKCFVQKK